MNPRENTEKLIRELVLPGNKASDERIVNDAMAAYEKQKLAVIEPNVWRMIWKSPVTRIAAAVIIVAISFFAVHQGPDEKIAKLDISQVTESPAKMLTVMSLNNAFRRGGTEAVEEQCNQAFEMLGLRPEKISIQELLADFNGG